MSNEKRNEDRAAMLLAMVGEHVIEYVQCDPESEARKRAMLAQRARIAFATLDEIELAGSYMLRAANRMLQWGGL